MKEPKRLVLTIVLAGALAAVAFLAWRRSTSDVTPRIGTESASEGAPHVDPVAVALAESDPRATGDARRAAHEGAEPSSTTDEREAALDASGPYSVHIAYADEGWFDPSDRAGRSESDALTEGFVPQPHGSLHWSDGSDSGATYAITDDRVTLPRAPKSAGEFTQLVSADLELRPLALERFGDSRPNEFELRVDFVPGATLVWAPSVAHADRQPVDIAIGGHFAPAEDAVVKLGARAGLIDVRRGLELPVVLPRSTESTGIWVGAATLQWRAFTVNPDDTRIEVALEPTASMRVHHEATSDAHVVTQALSRGRPLRHPIVDGHPVVVEGLAADVHRIWIEDARGEAISHVVDVELVSGETADVDLRASAALDGLGGVRVSVRVDAEVRALAPAGLAVELLSLPTDGSQPRDVGAPRRIESTDVGEVHEALGLAPARYFVLVKPFAAWTEVDVHAGAVSDVEIDVACVGFVRLDVPPANVGTFIHLALESLDRPQPRDVELSIDAPEGDPAEYLVPLVCGNYAMHIDCYAGPESGRLASDPFSVGAGATSVVVLRDLPKSTARVDVVDAATGEALGFDISFWADVRAFDLERGDDVVGVVSFAGTSSGASTSVTWTLLPHEGPVRVSVPEHPNWAFEPIEPLELTDGATITLRATAK